VTETVFLNSLDGFGFESFCQRLFEMSGWGRVEQIGGVADKGRDLIIHTPNGGKIIVECKHQPNSSIGRPIVQKLHSAIISSNTDQGIIITTGKFSKQAIECAQELPNVKIQLFDMHKIGELAQKAGIHISYTGEDFQIYTYPVRYDGQLRNLLLSKFTNVQSNPTKIADCLKINTKDFTLVSVYVATIDLYQNFSTSVGDIHQINVKSEMHYVQGDAGQAVEFSSPLFIHTQNTPILFDKTKYGNSVTVRPFNLETTTLSEKIKDTVVNRKTINVSYYGNNNVRYEKTCIPSKKNIRINDIKQILLPQYQVNLQIFTKNYFMWLIENKDVLNIPETDFFTCRICNQKITEDRFLLCNSCGNICHPEDIKKAHSYLCENCDKTICKNCTYYARKYLFMKKKLCQICAEQISNTPKKLVKDPPQKICQKCHAENSLKAKFCRKCGVTC